MRSRSQFKAVTEKRTSNFVYDRKKRRTRKDREISELHAYVSTMHMRRYSLLLCMSIGYSDSLPHKNNDSACQQKFIMR